MGWESGSVPRDLKPGGTQETFSEGSSVLIDGHASSYNVTALVGKQAVLSCFIRNINNHSVSFIPHAPNKLILLSPCFNFQQSTKWIVKCFTFLSLFSNIQFWNFQISWIRHRDTSLLAVNKFVYTTSHRVKVTRQFKELQSCPVFSNHLLLHNFCFPQTIYKHKIIVWTLSYSRHIYIVASLNSNIVQSNILMIIPRMYWIYVSRSSTMWTLMNGG